MPFSPFVEGWWGCGVGWVRPLNMKYGASIMIKISREQSFFITLAFSIFCLVVFWLTLAPSQFGGPVTYTIVNGNSMEPGFLRGDLVLIRREAVYVPGDAVVYRDPLMGQYVFHRIVDVQMDHFVLKGDNNGWLDSYHPTQGEIVGKLWAHLPKVGNVIQWMRMPLNAAIVTVLFGVLFMMDMIKPTPEQKRALKPAAVPGAWTPLMVYGALTVFFIALGIVAFTRPMERPAATIPYQQTGDYSYSATGTPGVYDTDTVRAGEPIFPKLTCFLNVGYSYNLLGENLQSSAGTYRTYARIMDEQSGWQRTISLTPDTPFTGGTFFTISTLDLCQVEALVNLVEAEAGLKQIAYTLEIVTDVNVAAYSGGNPLQDTFSHALVFKYDKIHFYLDEVNGQADPLFLAKSGTVGSTESQMNTVTILGLPIPIWLLRLVSVMGFLICGLALAGSATEIYRTASQSEEALIRLRYGAWLVNIQEQPTLSNSHIVDVASFDDLARIAERGNSMILHLVRNFLHFYFVQNNGVTYRYVFTSGKKGVTVEELSPAREPLPVAAASSADLYEEAQPLRISNRLIYTYPPQKEIPGLDQVHVKPASSGGITWAPSDAPEYVVDDDDTYKTADMDATLIHKLKL